MTYRTTQGTQRYVAAWMVGDTCIYMVEHLSHSPETLITLSISYIRKAKCKV